MNFQSTRIVCCRKPSLKWPWGNMFEFRYCSKFSYNLWSFFYLVRAGSLSVTFIYQKQAACIVQSLAGLFWEALACRLAEVLSICFCVGQPQIDCGQICSEQCWCREDRTLLLTQHFPRNQSTGSGWGELAWFTHIDTAWELDKL